MPKASTSTHVSAVVMDEFHSFADPERGIVWELSLTHAAEAHSSAAAVRDGRQRASNSCNWLERCHGRKLELVEGKERKVPLTYHWVPDQFLTEQLVRHGQGRRRRHRTTPALVFCFNRDECWSVAEQLKGLTLLTPTQKAC